MDAAEAGAAILHLHARDPDTGKPTQDPEAFRKFLPRLKQATGAVLNLTTGGSPHMTVAERMRPVLMTTLTTTFGLAPLVLIPGAGTELYRGVGAVVLFGLLFTSAVTLTVLPCLLARVLSWTHRTPPALP